LEGCLPNRLSFLFLFFILSREFVSRGFHWTRRQLRDWYQAFLEARRRTATVVARFQEKRALLNDDEDVDALAVLQQGVPADRRRLQQPLHIRSGGMDAVLVVHAAAILSECSGEGGVCPHPLVPRVF
jgi:hypothetical protein